MLPVYEITLEQILKARDRRAEKQKKLIMRYELPLISLTVNMPGARKNTPLCSSVFREGCSELVKRLKDNGELPAYQESNDLLTGSEAYVAVDMDECTLKELTLHIENTHPLGRLWDFDVIGRDGMAISREALGYPKRKCFLCEEDAHACTRSKAHSLDELLKKIQLITDTYFLGKGMT